MTQEASKPGLGQEVRVTSLVDVQPGAVVSRELISKPQGTVSIFAFDEGEGLSEHTAPFDALVHALEGKVRVTLGGVPHEVSEGEIIDHAGQRAPRSDRTHTLQDDAGSCPRLAQGWNRKEGYGEQERDDRNRTGVRALVDAGFNNVYK